MGVNQEAAGLRSWYQNISGQLDFVAGTGDTTLVTARSANHTLYIQEIIVWISTDAAQSISFEDSNGTALQAAEVTTSPGDSTRWDFWYGDTGFKLTEGKNLVMNVSAAGLAGTVIWYGYQRLSSTVAAGPLN